MSALFGGRIMETSEGTEDQQRKVLGILWIAMLNAVGIYALVCLFVVEPLDSRSAEEVEWLRYVLSAAAVGLGVLSVWWRRQFLSPDRAVSGEPTAIEFTQLQTHSLIVWAFSEAIALLGLVLGFLTHSFREFAPFALAAAALLLLHRPTNLPINRAADARQ